MHIVGAFLDIPAKYEVSVINTFTRTAVHRCHICWCRQDHDSIYWWNHESWLYRRIGMYAKWESNNRILVVVLYSGLPIFIFLVWFSWYAYFTTHGIVILTLKHLSVLWIILPNSQTKFYFENPNGWPLIT